MFEWDCPTCNEIQRLCVSCKDEQDVEAQRKEAYEKECPACRDFWDKPTDLVCSQCGR